MKFICKQCNREFEADHSNRIFCSQSCAAIYNNSRRGKKQFCLNCGNEIMAKKGKRKFCSRKCSATYNANKKIIAWKNGTWSGTDKSGDLTKRIKRVIAEERGNKCERCGWNEVNEDLGYPPLQIHHKNGIWNDNRLENIEVLCPNCHSLTDTYGRLNKNGGRPRG